MARLVRTVMYLSLSAALLLFLLPPETLERAALARPAEAGAMQLVGAGVATLGAALAVWCVLVFTVVGRGTPLPFDPPRRLVVTGPYRFVRNPMAVGVGSALVGAALFFESRALAAVAAGFFVIVHLVVVLYEEPTLRRMFGDEYGAYRDAVRRWWPRWRAWRP